MILLGIFLKFLHVLAAFALVGGEVGRAVVFQRAKQATDVKIVAAMLQMFTFFTSKFVSIGGLLAFLLGFGTAGMLGIPILTTKWIVASLVLYILIMLLVAFIAIPRGKVIVQALGAALKQEKITPELTAALNDKVLNSSFIIQNVLILLIIILMVFRNAITG